MLVAAGIAVLLALLMAAVFTVGSHPGSASGAGRAGSGPSLGSNPR
jgi:hypothetical protein